MTCKLLTAAAFSLALGTAAFAQTNDATTQPEAGAAPTPGAENSLPSGWEGAIGDAFFSDAERGTLLSQEEAQANWQNLTDEQQAQVRANCETVDTAATGTPDAAPDTAAGATDQEDTGMTTGSTTPEAGDTHTASIQQVCAWVDAM